MSISTDRQALRRALLSSLNEALLDETDPRSSLSLLSSNLTAQPTIPPTGLAQLPPSNALDASFLASRQQSLVSQCFGLPGASRSLAGISPFSLTSEDFLLSAATVAASERKNQLLLEQARNALLQQQLARESERIFMQKHYLSLLGNSSLQAKAIESFQSKAQLAQPLSSPAQQQQQATAQASLHGEKALEALGSNLRSKTDPYIDVSAIEDPDPQDSNLRRTRGGVSEPFPEKLHRMLSDLEKDSKLDIVSFYSHGRAFGVHDMDRFVKDIMPKYFKMSKWNSFARQLNLYGFIRITSGPDAGGYYHELFLKGRPNLCLHMRRVGVPQGEDRRKFKPKNANVDPDFYSMKKVSEEDDS